MTIRNRTRTTPLDSGKYGVNNYNTNAQPAFSSVENTVDNVGNPHIMNNFDSILFENKEVPTTTRKIGVRWYQGMIPIIATNAGTSTTTFRSMGGLKYPRGVLETIAASHPGNPKVSIPNFVYELKELPLLFKQYIDLCRKYGNNGGRRRAPEPSKDAASSWLAWNFGVAPMISDLKNIYNVAEGVTRAAKYYYQARTHGHVSRTLKRGEATDRRVTNNVAYSADLLSCFGTSVTDIEGRAWTCSWWRATTGLPLYSLLNGGHRDLLLDQLGLDFSLDQVYNAIPWSWLVDWCTDASSIISIYSNKGGFSFMSACDMEHLKFDRTITPYGSVASQLWDNKPVVQHADWKRRNVVVPTVLDAQMNIFDERQLSILASLFVGKADGGITRRM